MPSLTPSSSKSPILLMPWLNIMSNSVTRKGAATLFLTTRARTRLPIISEPCLMDSVRRRSMRTEL